MQQETKSLVGIGLVCLAVFGIAFLFYRAGQQASGPVDPTRLMREDSHSTASGPYAYKATLVEFGDFQCPGCAGIHPSLEQVLSENPNQVNFVFRHFPLSQHKNAPEAAEAAEAAGAQGKFWEMHDLLFEHQEEWAERANPLEIFTGYAKTLGLDTQRFRQEVSENRYANTVRRDQDDGEALGVNSTPTFYLNGEKIVDYDEYPGTPGFEARLRAILRAQTPAETAPAAEG